MKNIAYCILLLLIPALLGAQTMKVSTFYHSQKLKKNAFHITVPGFLIRLGASIAQKNADNESEKMVFRMIKRVKWARVLIIEDNPRINSKKVNKMVSQLDKRSDFESLITIREGKSRVNVMIREKNDHIKNLFILVHDDSEFAMIYMKTKLSMDKLSKFLKGLDTVQSLDKVMGKIPGA